MTIAYDEALKQSDQNRSLLIGNGFSIAQAGGQFSYSALLDKSGLQPDSPIRQLFDSLATVDFELVMRALQDAARVESAYGADDRATIFRNDAAAVREALIQAVRQVHPGVQFDIPQEQRQQCAAFLRSFENIFTVNYDLLLYWVILKMGGYSFTDGFGLGQTVGGFRTFSEEGTCNTFYLHGALHLFLGAQRDTQKRIVTTGTIISDISDTIRNRQELPLFVAEGTARQKMARINSVPYFRYCYDKLKTLTGTLIIFGHSVAENDFHLYDAIFESGLNKLFVCVHQPEANLQGTKERLAQFRERNDRIAIEYVDSASVKVWQP
ncbi:DUF4917 family protein [Bradyrhizobium ganzhouense]|uniref:DUF4917 family protein n=1 Tax=Bradyrhizobium ganzhouense TaxID=1179767 RepID=UPI003CF57D89